MINESNLVEKIEPIIRQAGDIIISYFNKDISFNQKKDNSIVTQADVDTEAFLQEALAKAMPEASFLGEESGLDDKRSDYVWVVDPLDGTTNFAHKVPYFCVSIALTYKDEPIFGMIYQPITDELFYAQKGKDAYLNNEKIQVACNPEGKQFILVGLPYAKGESFMRVLRNIEHIAPQFNAFRHLGAIALDQAYVACGRADALFFEDLGWWDIAAGKLLIEEAGGMVTSYDGLPVGKDYKSYLAAHPTLHGKLLPILKDHAQNNE